MHSLHAQRSTSTILQSHHVRIAVVVRSNSAKRSSGGASAAGGGGGGWRAAKQQQQHEQQRRRGSGSTRQQGDAGGLTANLSALAQSASRRATRFSRQRLERALSSGGDSGSDDGDEGDGAGGDDDGGALPPGLEPFIDVAVAAIGGRPGSRGAAADSDDDDDDDGDGGGGSGAGGARASGRGRGARRGAARTLMEAYVASFGAALDLELEEEWAEAERRLRAWPKERLAAEGVALFGLSAAPDGQVYRDSVLKFFRPEAPLPFHALSQVCWREGRGTRMRKSSAAGVYGRLLL